MAVKVAGRKYTSFKDRLSRFTFHQACQLLGEDGKRLIHQGSRKFEAIDPDADVYLGGDLFRVRVPDHDVAGGKAIVVLTQIAGRTKQLHLTCDQCEAPCLHAGAALAMLLEEKTLLGLAAAPDESVPFELLTREELIARAWDERRQRATAERMTLRSLDPNSPWTDYVLTSHQSGKTYRVCLQGEQPGQAYCSCPDFRTNRLGVCKHILQALEKVRKRFSKSALAKPYRHRQVALFLDYQADPVGLRFHLPDKSDEQARKIVGSHSSQVFTDASDALARVGRLQQAGQDVVIYPDAEAWIDRQLTQDKLRSVTDRIRKNPARHPLRKTLLKVELLPYQLDGIAFAVGAGRAVLADDMGLGKTIQGIGVAELLARELGIRRVLVVCPASLKSQWKDEIRRFCERTVQTVIGRREERIAQYRDGAFFTVCNYEQVLHDVGAIEEVDWDLIILDEGQRIKNWESKTSQVVRSLHSRFALVLSGTPLENRLDELYTIVKFVDEQRLGPAYEFFHQHRVVSDTGRVEGFQRLDQLRERLKPILLRRTRGEVMSQLPERTTEVVRIPPTEEQVDLHQGFMKIVVRITRKAFLTEMDLLQLQRALLMCRLCANSTFLVDKQEPGYSTKLDRLAELLEDLSGQSDRKIILFSEWRKMLDLIEPQLNGLEMPFVRLDGQVPQKQRAAIVHRFQKDADCRAILMTNAGSTGLNLQAANTVINVDLPWNPAVLEQRIARAHRMGQKNPVHAYLLVTEQTLEEKLLDTLATKRDLALAALDPESNVTEIKLESGMEELRRRLERLLGEQPEAPIDVSRLNQVEAEAKRVVERRERVAAAAGQFLSAALQMVDELLADGNRPAPEKSVVSELHSNLTQCVERDADGRAQLRLTLPDDAALAQVASTLARLLLPAARQNQ